jgi:hypothetical protein
LTLHGTLEEEGKAAVLFGSDLSTPSLDGEGVRHTFLPHLISFRCVLIGHDDDFSLWTSIIQLLKGRMDLRRLDLGSCPWDLVRGLLEDGEQMNGLRVLRLRIPSVSEDVVKGLVKFLPKEMVALHLSTKASTVPIVCHFLYFPSLSAKSISL